MSIRVPSGLWNTQITAKRLGVRGCQSIISLLKSGGQRGFFCRAAHRRHRARETTNKGSDQVKKNPHIGSSLDGFLKEEGILEEARAAALKEALAWQVQKRDEESEDQLR